MSAHAQAQLLRFARLFAFALDAQLLALGTADLGWKTLAAAIVGAAETAVRQVLPVTVPEPTAPTPAAGESGTPST